MNWLGINLSLAAKYLVVELAPPYAQSAWGSGGKMVRAAGLAACCNYLLKRKKKLSLAHFVWRDCLINNKGFIDESIWCLHVYWFFMFIFYNY